MSIKVLPKILVDKIAAGEVIERPASVVKELVENAVDAQAARIEVELENGGALLIRVIDDGNGIPPSDLPLAFQSHATSKLEGEDDLFDIKTMGFRGEALSSIASVAQCKIISRTKNQEEGYEIGAEGGKLGEVKVCAAPQGTQIEVRNLFYNVPVRRKFLKTQATEMAHITETVTRLALANPEIAFTLKHNSRRVITLPSAQNRKQRLGEFFGAEIADNIIPFNAQFPAVDIEGYLLPPDINRANTNMQYTFVNRRYIREKTLMHAVSEAYRGLMHNRRRPVCFLFLTIDPKNIDVNVHPAKIEVKFRQNREIHNNVLKSMKKCLREAKLTPQMQVTEETEPGFETKHENVRNAIADFFGKHNNDFSGSFDKKHLSNESHQPPHPEKAPPAINNRRLETNENGIISYNDKFRHASQFLDSYIVEECSEGIRIIDQHALHERILYEKMKQDMGEGPLASQKLLVPELVELPAAEFYAVIELKQDLHNFGMEIDSFGDETIIVRSFPQILGRFDGTEFFRDLLDEVNGPEGLKRIDSKLDKLLIVMACKGAVKAGQRLSANMMRDILQKRNELELDDTCPHGRPTTILLSSQQLRKQFKRM